jgi:hypothetical protein
MPTILPAKTIAENALSTIGAFPASQVQADAGEMKKTLTWLEMILNTQAGIRPMPGYWQTLEIPIEANVGDYNLSDYTDESGAVHVFSVSIIQENGEAQPLEILYEGDSALENLTMTGSPKRVVVTKSTEMILKVYPMPTIAHQNQGLKLRVRLQSYHKSIDPTGVDDSDVNLLPCWYLWITNKLAYEIGKGPVRRLPEGELKRLQDDANDLERMLIARNGQYISSKPPVTEPMAGSY